MYYRVENTFCWYKVECDGQPKEQEQAKSVVCNRIFSYDELDKMQETISSALELEKWLKRNQLPPDGYKVPFNNVYQSDLVKKMLSEIHRYGYAKRFYAVLSDKDANVCDILNIAMHCFLDEEQIDEKLRPIHMKKYLDMRHNIEYDEYVRMNIMDLIETIRVHYMWDEKIEERPSDQQVPHILSGYLGCVDECIHMLLGFSPTMDESFVCAKIFSAIWADICSQYGEELQKKWGYDQGYGDSKISVPWWRNPKGIEAIKEYFETQKAYLNGELEYYIGKFYGGMFKYKRFPGDLTSIADAYDWTNRGLIWKSVEEMLSETLSGDFYLKNSRLWLLLVGAMDDFVSFHLNNSKIRIDTERSFKIFVSERIVDALYVSLSNRIIDGEFHYRKCLMCNRYFDYGNKANRKYCDIHNGSNAEYHRRRLNKEIKNTL